jgi:YbbR domain-containing protein
LEKDENIYYWLPNLYRDELQAQMDAQTSLLRLEPDTVFFVLSDRVKKRVPVINEVNPAFASGYRKYQNAQIKPTHVTISGPMVYIDSIAYVKTEALQLSNINGDVDKKIDIEFDHPLVTVNPPEVSYHLDVDQFTEKKITLPIKLRNIPEDNKVSIYPAQVDVYCKVGLRDFDKLDQNTVTAVCDLNQLKEHPNRKRLQIEITCDLPNVEIGRSSQKTVDFLIF